MGHTYSAITSNKGFLPFYLDYIDMLDEYAYLSAYKTTQVSTKLLYAERISAT